VPHVPRPRVPLASLITPADNYLSYVEECIARYQRLELGHVSYTLKPTPQKVGERFVMPDIVPMTIYPQHRWRGIPIADLCLIMKPVLETGGHIKSYKQIAETLCASMEGTGKTYTYKQVHRACKLLRIQFCKPMYLSPTRESPDIQSKLAHFIINHKLEDYDPNDIFLVDETDFTLDMHSEYVLLPIGFAATPGSSIVTTPGRRRGRPRLGSIPPVSETEESAGEEVKQVRSRGLRDSTPLDDSHEEKGSESSSEEEPGAEEGEPSSEEKEGMVPSQSFKQLCRDQSQPRAEDTGTWTVTAAMNAHCGGYYMLTKGASTAESFTTFLKCLRERVGHQRQIYIVCGSDPMHDCVNRDGIFRSYNYEVQFTPPSCPELNAVELVFSQWKHAFKERTTHTKQDIRKEIKAVMEATPIDSRGNYDHVLDIIEHYQNASQAAQIPATAEASNLSSTRPTHRSLRQELARNRQRKAQNAR